MVRRYSATLHAAFDLQAASDGLVVIQHTTTTSLDAALDLHASDRLVVLQVHPASFYVCLDSQLTTLLIFAG